MTRLRIQLPTFRTRAPRGAEPLADLAFRVFTLAASLTRRSAGPGWSEQFSPASLDEFSARGKVDALYRGGAVRP
jgi:hypothetical protein